MQLSSSSIVNGKIQKQHACASQGGSDTSLQLTVRDIPADALYIAIVGDDPDAMKPARKVWVHWNVFNVPAQNELVIDAGQQLAGQVGRTTGHAKSGYEGPCPPDGTHTYRFAVFAYQDPLDATAWHSPLTIDAFKSKFGDRMLATAMITGTFG